MSCPSCRKDSVGTNFEELAPVNYILRNIIEVVKSQADNDSSSIKCEFCESVASVYCPSCESYICSKDEEAHLQNKFTAKHKVVNAKDASKQQKVPECSHHSKAFELYCTNCSSLICSLCFALEHKQHDIISVKDAAEKQRKRIIDMCSDMSARMKELENLIASDRTQMADKENIIAKIQKEIDVLRSNILQRATQKHEIELQLDGVQRLSREPSDYDMLSEEKFNNILSLVKSQIPSMNDLKINPRVNDVRIDWNAVRFLRAFGSQGSADGQFSSPGFCCVTSAGEIIVADMWNHRIQIFGGGGEFIRAFGSIGKGNGQFNYPCGVCVNSTDEIIVTDYNNHRIQVFSRIGEFVRSFGSQGRANGQFSGPSGVCVNSVGDIIVSDSCNHRIQMFSGSGEFIRAIGNGQFNCLDGICVNSTGEIIVADYSFIIFNLE